MKKALTFVGVVLIGSVVMVAVDALVGVSFKEDVTTFAKITHNVARMLWGGVFILVAITTRRGRGRSCSAIKGALHE